MILYPYLLYPFFPIFGYLFGTAREVSGQVYGCHDEVECLRRGEPVAWLFLLGFAFSTGDSHQFQEKLLFWLNITVTNG